MQPLSIAGGDPSRFVHLSDIHFSRYHDDGQYDLDRDLRDQIERDIVRMKENLGEFAGVLVTGDIAFSGQREEYEAAAKWLVRVCEILELGPQYVWVVPGNHDVDWQLIRTTNLIPMLHDRLRSRPTNELTTELRSLLTQDSHAAELLFTPLAAYNEFAAVYQCATTPEEPSWSYDLPLNDGSTLTLWGMNSVVASGPNDAQGNLLLGEMQVNLPERDGHSYLTLCHHPPSWLLDHDRVDEALTARAHIQLFGHRHSHSLQTINNTVRISAGAVHPDRADWEWLPHYNILEVRVDWPDPESRELVVGVHTREWDGQERKFKPRVDSDGQFQKQVRIPLAAWTPPMPTTDEMVESPEADPVTEPSPTHEVPQMDPLRRVTYLLLTLPHHRQHEVLRELDLLPEAGEPISELQAVQKALGKAVEQNLLDQLNIELREIHGIGSIERD